MAKAAYKPTQMLREDPLAALKQATVERGVDQAVLRNEEVAKPIAAVPPETEQRSEPAGNPAVERKQFRPGNAGSSIAPVKPLAKSLNPMPHKFAAADESSRNGKLFLQRVDDKAGRILDPVALTRTHLRFEVLDRMAASMSGMSIRER
jgi:hypothetical protein